MNNNPAQGGGNNGGYGTGGATTTNNGTQQNLQAQLVQQLSQQLSQSMGQKFPQQNLQALLQGMQAQMQNPPQAQQQQQQQQPQLPPELLALARSGNFAGMNPMANTTQQQQQAPAPMVGQPAAAAGHLQQLSVPNTMGAPSAAPAMPVVKDSNNNNNNTLQPQQQKPADPPSLGNVGEVRAGFQGQPSTATSGGNLMVDAAKDERRKAPGSVIVPCRARGMPMDHNFKTAYFVIPENVRHGEELICSYFACRNAGVKFRYCSHCKVPVAKRNFRKRHKHGDNIGKDGASGEDDDDNSAIEEDGCSDEGESPNMPPSHSQGVVPSQVTTGRSNNRKEAIPSQVTTTTKTNDGDRSSKKKKSSSLHIPSQVTTNSNNTGNGGKKMKSKNGGDAKGVGGGMLQNGSLCMRSGDDRSKVIECRKNRWATLLEKRPQTKDGEAMSSWLMQVLAVSDLWKPLNESEKMPNASLDLIRECAQAGTDKKKKANSSKEKKKRRSGDGDDSGSSDSQQSQDSTNNQDGQGSKKSSIDSDNQDRMSPTDEEKRMLLKKRPVAELKNDESEEKSEELPTVKQKLETETELK